MSNPAKKLRQIVRKAAESVKHDINTLPFLSRFKIAIKIMFGRW